MSVLVDFVENCLNIPLGNKFYFFVENAISSIANIDFEKEKNLVKKSLKSANDNGNILTIAMGIKKCQEYCNEKTENFKHSKEDKNLKFFVGILDKISVLITEILHEPENTPTDNLSDITNINTVLHSYEDKIKELQNKLEALSSDLTQQNSIFDSKIFQLLVNTISILGIFVAIAFAGFGGTTILSNITIDMKANFLLGVFSLLLIGLFIYNLLLLLIYFIFIILKNFYTPRHVYTRFNFPYTLAVFKPLFIIDSIWLVVTIVLFFFLK